MNRWNKRIGVMVVATVLSLTGCGESEATASSAESVASSVAEVSVSSESTAESLAEAVQSAVDSIADEYDVQDVTESLDTVCQYLEEKGIVSGSQTKMAGEMIGAVSGVKYSDSKVEIYEYDTDSEKYKTLVETNKVVLEGFGIEMAASAINGQYVLFCDEAENKADIITAFNEIPR